MKHFKLSKELTLGQNLTALVLILNVLVILSPTQQAQASIWDMFKSSDSENACEKIEKDLNDKLREMAGACSSTDMGRGCLQSIFTCNEDNTDSAECESFSEITASPTKDNERRNLDDQKDQLEALEKKKNDLQDRQEAAQKEVDDLNSKYEDKVRELDAADTELQNDLKNTKNETAEKLSEIQANNKVLDAQNDALFIKTLEQKKQIINIMKEERLKCSSDAKKEGEKFYAIMRTCMSGQGNCNISFNSFVKNGGKSLAEMTKSYERRQARKCLRVDGNNDFSIRYRAMQAEIKVNESAILKQQQIIAKNRAELSGQVLIAQANGELAKSEATLKHTKTSQILSQEKARLQLQISAKAEAVKNYVTEVKALQDQIESQNSEIASARKSLSSSMDGKDLNKLREAQLTADSLASEAEYAVKNNKCGCSGALKNISDLSGKDFCGSSPETETQDVPVELEDVTAE
jgi:chromosome segregation ATPase